MVRVIFSLRVSVIFVVRIRAIFILRTNLIVKANFSKNPVPKKLVRAIDILRTAGIKLWIFCIQTTLSKNFRWFKIFETVR